MKYEDLKIGDWVRVIKVPDNMLNGDDEAVNKLFENSLGQTFRVESRSRKYHLAELKVAQEIIEGAHMEICMNFLFFPPDCLEASEGPPRDHVSKSRHSRTKPLSPER